MAASSGNPVRRWTSVAGSWPWTIPTRSIGTRSSRATPGSGGSSHHKDPWINQDPGWIEGFGFDEEGARIDPRKRDGLYLGPSRGHVDGQKGGEIGIPRAYGYGATMGAWALDYLGFWAGNDGMVRHSKMQFRGPSFEGDVTYVDGEVTAREAESAFGVRWSQSRCG